MRLLSVRLLVIVALPVAIVTTVLAEPLVYLLSGSQYLPHSRIALQLMIWSIPIGFINSVTHYVLIALNQQRFLTKAFAIGLAFTLVANRVFIPLYSYRASALIHLFSELALLLPFYYCLRSKPKNKRIGNCPTAGKPGSAHGVITVRSLGHPIYQLLWGIQIQL